MFREVSGETGGTLSHSRVKTGVRERGATRFSKHLLRIEESFGKRPQKHGAASVKGDKAAVYVLLHWPVVSDLNNGGPCSRQDNILPGLVAPPPSQGSYTIALRFLCEFRRYGQDT